MTLLQIKYLCAVAKTGNVSHAANELFVSRPAISRALRELEDEFGIPLFYRTNSGLALTQEGRFFYEKCEQIMKMSDTLDAQMHTIRDKLLYPANRVLRLGVTPSTGVIVFVDFFKKFMEKYQNIEIVTLEYRRQQARQALENGTMDVNLTADNRPENYSSDYEVLDLFNVELAVHVNASHRLAGYERVTVEDIKDEPLVYLSEYYQNEVKVADMFAEAGYTPYIRMRSLQLSTIRKMVCENLGCAILMQGTLNNNRDIVAIPFSQPVVFTIGFIWNSAIPHGSAFDDFLSFAREYQKECRQSGRLPFQE